MQMSKCNSLEDMEDLFFDTSYTIDCFDAFLDIANGVIYQWLMTIVFTIALIASGLIIGYCFTWWRIIGTWVVYFCTRWILTGALSVVSKAIHDSTVKIKLNVINNLLDRFYAPIERMSQEDREIIISQFIASRFGLTVDTN